ncbi:exported protein of unknown function [Candidatus Hydrogenisulfobacillus filiaventi]|uniref:Cytochrome c domain-containing protein n=1 Tax=Candidatus Hydrogenisulfobacillus filiaventi TaxID=2707344 RepID=A0A6F8ZFW3_9FIRM|nr:cytochrome c [Bacillota bacterium]CAB1128824.1 exported protein of unknown function [Candidatus Hydrogenisulfobacillus filiaventi]
MTMAFRIRHGSITLAVLLAGVAGGAGACGRAPAPSPPAAPAPRPDIAAGRTLYRQTCSTCHGPAGGGTPSGPALNRGRQEPIPFASQTALTAFIQANMPANAPGSLSPAQAADVGAYVWTLMYPRH